MTRPKAVFCWSGGKDSAYCLHKVLAERSFDVRYLLTTVNAVHKRVSMHGVREELVEAQAGAIGIPLLKVSVSEGTNNEYEREMEKTLLKAKGEGIEHVIFGDIFLEDLRAYREKNLAAIGMKGVFPLWKMNTTELISDFIGRGFKTIVCCINDGRLDKEWAGRKIDRSFVVQLPSSVDPCGENGEYHTFCYGGPLFKNEIRFSVGETVYKPLEVKYDDCTLPSDPATKGFWFCDLLIPDESPGE